MENKKESNKGGAPKGAWEVHYNLCPYSKSKWPMHAFDARQSKDRMVLYEKVNKTDH